MDGIRLVLLDRDGVLNVDSPQYVKSAHEWRAIPGSIEAVVGLQQTGLAVAVCTNQAGIGRGLFDESALAAIHEALNAAVTAAGGAALDVFYCPHHPDDRCGCRKPAPGLLVAAMRAAGAAPGETVYVGDSEKDLLAADRAGCGSALVMSGNGAETARTARGRAAPCHADLAAFARSLGATARVATPVRRPD